MSSRPLSWINTAFPFAAAYLVTTRSLDVTLVVGTLYFLIPYNLTMYGINDVFDYESDLRNPRKGGVEGALLDRRLHRATPHRGGGDHRAVPRLSRPRRAAAVLAGARRERLRGARLLRAGAALQGASLSRLDHLEHALRLTRRVRAGARGRRGSRRSSGSCWRRSFCGARPPTPSVAVQDVVADREGGIASIATVIGARATVRVAVLAYLAAGVLVLFASWPGPLAAVLALAYARELRAVLGRVGCQLRGRQPRLEAVPRAQLRRAAFSSRCC